MKRLGPYWKVIMVITIVFFSWPLFFFLTFGSNSIVHIIPLLILILQIIVSFLYKKGKLLALLVLNPVVFFVIFYTIKPTINYFKGTPTKMKCSYNIASSPNFDQKESVFLDYYDDDCDWDGLYYYTLDINNEVTDVLIILFGNPIIVSHNNALDEIIKEEDTPNTM